MPYYLTLIPRGRTETFETLVQAINESLRLKDAGQQVGKIVDTNKPKRPRARGRGLSREPNAVPSIPVSEWWAWTESNRQPVD
jgi:hypothetical protein